MQAFSFITLYVHLYNLLTLSSVSKQQPKSIIKACDRSCSSKKFTWKQVLLTSIGRIFPSKFDQDLVGKVRSEEHYNLYLLFLFGQKAPVVFCLGLFPPLQLLLIQVIDAGFAATATALRWYGLNRLERLPVRLTVIHCLQNIMRLNDSGQK